MAANLTVQDLFRAIARSWPVLLVVTALSIAAAAGAYVLFPQRYTASAQHTVEPIAILSTGSTFNTVNMQTESVVATSDSVLKRAASKLGGSSVSDIREATTVTVPRSSQLLTISVTTDSGATSAKWANAIATSYGEQRTANAQAVREQIAADLTKSINRLRALYESQPVRSSERETTQLQIQALLDQQARLAATPLFAGLLVTVATDPGSPDRPSLAIFLAGGAVVGVLLGSVVALLFTRLRRNPMDHAEGTQQPTGRSKVPPVPPTWTDA